MANGPDPILEGLAAYVLAPVAVVAMVVYFVCTVGSCVMHRNDPPPPPKPTISYKAGQAVRHSSAEFVKGLLSR